MDETRGDTENKPKKLIKEKESTQGDINNEEIRNFMDKLMPRK